MKSDPTSEPKPELTIASRIPFDKSPAHHVLSLLGEAVKTFLANVPHELEHLQQDLQEIVSDMDAALKKLEGMGFDSADIQHFAEIMSCTVTVFKCCFPAESDKPSPSAARASRKMLYAAANKTGGHHIDLAKPVLTYAAGKTAMEQSKAFCASGLEDEAAQHCLDDAITTFENEYEVCFDDLQNWLEASPDGASEGIECLGKKLSPLTGIITSLTSAANKLSMMALERRLQNMVTLSLNLSQLVAACIIANPCASSGGAHNNKLLPVGKRGVMLAQSMANQEGGGTNRGRDGVHRHLPQE